MLKRSLGLYSPHPLWNALPIVRLASVPIWELWPLGRDTIMYPPVQIIPGVVDQSWIGTWEAGSGVWHGQLTNSSLPYCRYAGIVLLEENMVSNILTLETNDQSFKCGRSFQILWYLICQHQFDSKALSCLFNNLYTALWQGFLQIYQKA